MNAKLPLTALTLSGLLISCGGGGGTSEDNSPQSTNVEFSIAGITDVNVAENTEFSSAVPTTSGDSPQGDLIWSISGNDAPLFELNTENGVFTLSAKDYERPSDSNADNTYQIQLTAVDVGNNSASKAVNVTVFDVDENDAKPEPEPQPEPEIACTVNSSSIASDALYVAMNGDDSNSGTETQPFASISAALNSLAANGVVNAAGKTIYVRQGEYHSEVENIALNGSPENYLSIEAYPCEQVTLTGAVSVNEIKIDDWKQFHGDIYKVEVDRPIWKLLVDDEMQMLARWPNANFSMPSSSNSQSVYSAAVWAEGEQDSGSKGTSVSNRGSKKDGIITNDVSGSDELVTYHNLATAKDYKGDLLDVSGAIIVANTASFYTYSRMVKAYNDMDPIFTTYNPYTGALYNYQNKDVAHVPGTNVFTHEPSLKAYKSKKLSFFLEAKVELIDQPGEWHYQKENGKHFVYLWHPNGGAPENNVKVRDISYSFNLENSNFIKISGFDFLASSLRCNPCNNITIENNSFKYSAADRRVLKIYGNNDTGYGRNQYIELYSATGKRNDSGIIFRNNKITDSGVQSLIVSGGQAIVSNNLFERLDWSSADTLAPHATVMTLDMTNQKVEFSYNTMDTIGNSSMFVPEGGSLHATYNDMGTGGFAQNDGASFQLRKAQQAAVNMSYNWAHDSEKYGIRFDAPFDTTNESWGGQWGMIHHNVVWNAKGIMVKGDDHRVYHNTTWNNDDVDLRMLIDPNIYYRHERSIAANNASDSISSKRNEITDISSLYLGQKSDTSPLKTHRENFNGVVIDGVGIDLSERLEAQLIDIHNRDFRPKRGGELHDAGEVIDSPNSFSNYSGSAPIPQYTETTVHGEALDLGAYELDSPYYWIPGFRGPRASFPIPRDEISDAQALDVLPTVTLMWREAYQGAEHYVYLATQLSTLENTAAGDIDSSLFKGSFMASEANIYQSESTLISGNSYYWRVDAKVNDRLIKGTVWKFTVK
ncbi:cadherin repeat domain-containing protein [Thalassotalea crassostreae]|uniref:cadherin repeat domain-containing protein n=1 Tax=Thalassotalea crassostreae TaxID=1763536 RepID=UPI000838D64B|nr:cadherin repeat domain-containing protein [Thalassotalea crassostreae]